MKSWNDREGGSGATGGRKAVLALAAVAAALGLVLVAGTVFGLATGARQRKLERDAFAAQSARAEASGKATFAGIGTLRASTADKKPAVVVATIAFPYDGADRAFAEELDRKAPVLRAAAQKWFSGRKADDLAPALEGGVKAALRDTFNGLLSLGKVDEIWLSDFTVIQ